MTMRLHNQDARKQALASLYLAVLPLQQAPSPYALEVSA